MTLDSPSRVLAVSRAARPDPGRGAGEHRGAQDRIAVPVPPAPRPERDQTGQVLRALKISEPALLARAAAIDHAAENLIDQATARTRRRISAGSTAPQPAHAVQARPGEPARTAGQDLPHPPRPARPGTAPGAAAPPEHPPAQRPASLPRSGLTR